MSTAERTFTDEQAAAILDDGGDLLLSAAAGSGKTSVLVERFVRHVRDDGVSPGRILAITFTEKAAGELRQRIRERLLELELRDAAREAEGAWISTVHGFCARLLRGHALTAGLDPGFAILDEPQARALRDEAWDRAFARWLDDRGDAALDLSASFGADALRAAITGVHDALRSAGATRPRLPVPAPAPLPDRAALLDARAAAARELAALPTNGPTIAKALDALERCESLFGSLADDALPEAGALGAVKVGAGAKALKEGAALAYREAYERFCSACAAHRGSRAAVELDLLLDAYGRAYADAKRSRSALDFDDLELLARDLLAGSPDVRAAYAERFERVMVDEFQDSNPLQVELFDLLGRENVFVVGDELQSIYGFRHADVEVFRRRRAEGRSLALTRNWRSRPEIIEAVNAAFAPRFGETYLPLVPGRAAAAEPRVEVLLTEQEGWDAVELGDLPRAATWRHAEARMVAQRIRDLVDAGDARPEDVVILLRAFTDLAVFERALEDAGLQTLAGGGRGYWGRQVVRDLCAWLAALANPSDEAQLYGVLASPLVGASTDALALVSGAGKGNAWRVLERAFLAGGDPAPPAVEDAAAALPARLGEPDRARLAAFARRFASERTLAPRLGLDVLLRRAVEVCDYDLHVLRLPGGARRLANVHKLVRLAAEHERAHGRDVRGLVDRANAELEADARETDAPVELGDTKAVRLMTMHAAKGLEFPVVVVADLGRLPSGDAPALMVDGDRLGLRLAGFDGQSEEALEYTELLGERKQAAKQEEDRIAYVATTRAEERLILSGGLKLAKWPDKLGSAPLGWLAPGLLGADGLPDDEAVVDGIAVVRNAPDTVGRVLREESLAPGGAELPPAPPPPARGPLPVPAPPGPPVRAFSYSSLGRWKRCGYRYYLQNVLRMPEDRTALPAPRPAPGAAPAALDARVRGSLVHAALEHLDARTDDDATIRRLLDDAAREYEVEPTAAEYDDMLGLVTGFADTPLAVRIAEARGAHREHPFAVPLGDVLLTGVVDVLATEDDGTALVVDYKTDRLAPDADLEALVDRDYGTQRRAYALAGLRAGAPRAAVAYAFLERPGEPLVTTFDAADADRLEAELRGLAEGMLSGRFEVAPEPHIDLCAGCPGRRALCVHPPELTGRTLEAEQAGS